MVTDERDVKQLHTSYDNLESAEHVVNDGVFRIRYAKGKALLSMVLFLVVWVAVMYGFFHLLKGQSAMEEVFVGTLKVKHFFWGIVVLTPLLVIGARIFKYLKASKFDAFLVLDLKRRVIKIPPLQYESQWLEKAPVFEHARYRHFQRRYSEFNVRLEGGERLPILHSVGYHRYYGKLEQALQVYGVKCERLEVDEDVVLGGGKELKKAGKKAKKQGLATVCLVAGVPFLLFGIVAFFQISAWGKQWEERKAKVERGEVPREKAEVVEKYKKEREAVLVLRVEGDEKIFYREPEEAIWRGVRKGDRLSVYRFGKKFFVPKTDVGGHEWGRWAFLAFGSLPLLIFSVLWVIAKRSKG